MKSLEAKFADVSKEFLERHYGFTDFSNLLNIDYKNINIGDIPGKLTFISADTKTGNKQLKIFNWEDNSSLNLGFPFTDNTGLLLRVLKSLRQKKIGELELTSAGSITRDFVDFQPISIDVTNLHYIVLTDNGKFRFKWYSRPEKGFREYQIHKLLSNLNLTPQPVLMLSYKNNAIFGLYKEISSIKNLDTVTGDLYKELLSGKITESEFYSQMKIYFAEIVKLILKIMRLDEKTDIRKFFERYDKEKWKQMLYSNWKGLIEAKIYGDKLEADLTSKYLAHLENYLENTTSNIVHGDMWLRQFGIDQVSNNYYLFDLEEMSLGPRTYDIASVLNSILQQLEYFRLKKPSYFSFTDNPADELVTTFLSNIPFLNDSYATEIRYAQCIRMIYELNYLVNYQPNDLWLIEFLKEYLRKTLLS